MASVLLLRWLTGTIILLDAGQQTCSCALLTSGHMLINTWHLNPHFLPFPHLLFLCRLSSMTGAHTPMRMPVCPSGYGGLLQQQQQQQHLPMPTPPNTTVMHTQAVPSSAAPATRLDGTHPLPAAALAAAQRDQTAAAAVPETALAASLRSPVNKRTPDGTGLLAAQYASAAVSQRKELAPDVDAAAPDAEVCVCLCTRADLCTHSPYLYAHNFDRGLSLCSSVMALCLSV